MLTLADPQKLLTGHPETIQIAVHQSVKKCPSIQLRTEGLGLFATRVRRNIEFLRSFLLARFWKSKMNTTFLLRSASGEIRETEYRL